MSASLTETGALLRLGVPVEVALRVHSYCVQNEEACYSQGVEDGKSIDSARLVGHRRIAQYLGCSVRHSERMVSLMRRNYILPAGNRGSKVVVEKRILDDFRELLADVGGSL